MDKLLIDLKPGEKGIIKIIPESGIKTTLFSMGFLPGEQIEISKIAPLGCPFAIYVSGSELSLRKKDAENILVETID